ncbi:MAG: hypothetical protein V4508_06505 [Pseudomonadota bacterium]
MKSLILPNRRRLRLLDHTLQQSLLIALVLLETVLVALAIWKLNQVLGRIVEENMYRIHFSARVSVLALLLSEGTPVLLAMLGVNCLALVLADRIWAWYVGGILRALGGLMEASSALDFSVPQPSSLHHMVLERASDWRQHEARRLARLRTAIGALPPELPATQAQRAALGSTLASLADD